MRTVCVTLFALLIAFATGCFSARPSAPDSFVCQVARNTIQSPIRDFDELRFTKVTKIQAEKSWIEYRDANGKCTSDAFHRGFVEGFVDYVQAGGTGEPPYLPPFRYRLTPFRTPEGIAAIEDWYAGFRQGAAIAKESGLRELNYVPLPGYAVPKDLNSPSAMDVGKSSPSTRPAVEGSPWDRPGSLPMPLPIPPPIDSIPTAPQPRPLPNPQAVPGQSSSPQRSSIPPQVLAPLRISEVRQVSVLPQVPETSTVQPAIANMQPVLTPVKSDADQLDWDAPSNPLSGAGPN
jgi:hypothetical protein